MSYSFAENWAQEIADVSSLPEFQNATITLYSGGSVITGAENMRARIIGVRSTLDVNGRQSGDATGSKALRIQFPYESYPSRVERGTRVRIVDGGRNPAMEDYLVTVDSDNMSSQRASHTLDCTVDMTSNAGWTP